MINININIRFLAPLGELYTRVMDWEWGGGDGDCVCISGAS